MTARALYDFIPTDGRHLGLKVGQIVIDVHHLGNGWATGRNELTGETGAFPANYIESNITEQIIKEEKKKALAQETNSRPVLVPDIQYPEHTPKIHEIPDVTTKPEIRQKPKLEISDPIPIKPDIDVISDDTLHSVQLPRKPKLPDVSTKPEIPKKPKPVISKPIVQSDNSTEPKILVDVKYRSQQTEDHVPDHEKDSQTHKTSNIPRPRGPPPPLPTAEPPSLPNRHPESSASKPPHIENSHPPPLPKLDPPLLQNQKNPPLKTTHHPLLQNIHPPLPNTDPPMLDLSKRQNAEKIAVSDPSYLSDTTKPKTIPNLPMFYSKKPSLPQEHGETSQTTELPGKGLKAIPNLPKIYAKRSSVPEEQNEPSHSTKLIDKNLKIVPNLPKIYPKRSSVSDDQESEVSTSESSGTSGISQKYSNKPPALPRIDRPIIQETPIPLVSDDSQSQHLNIVKINLEKTLGNDSIGIPNTTEFTDQEDSGFKKPTAIPISIPHPLAGENSMTQLSNLESLPQQQYTLFKDSSQGQLELVNTAAEDKLKSSAMKVKEKSNKIVASKPKPKPLKKTKANARPRHKRNRRKRYGYKDIIGRKHAFSCTKACYGTLGGLLTGTIFFLMLIFFYSFDYVTAGWITLGFTLLVCIGMALSSYVRLLIILMVPGLFTGKGRTAFLSVIFGVLLAGPVFNIFHNGKEMGKSMACIAQLIKKQVMALAKQLAEPIVKIAKKLNETFHEMLDSVEEVLQKLQPIIDAVRDFEEALKAAADFVSQLNLNCTDLITTANQKCKDGVNSAKKECEDAVNKYDPTNYVKDTGEDIYNNGKDTISGALGRRRRDIVDNNGNVDVEVLKYLIYKRYKRGLDSVCAPLDVSSACNILNNVNDICSPLTNFQADMMKIINKTLEDLKLVTEFFIFGIDTDLGLSGDVNVSKSALSIVDDVTNAITAQADLVAFVVKIISQVMILTLLILFIKSILYIKNYNSKDRYDNTYITKGFKKFDAACALVGKKTVLPLKRREIRKYSDTTSIILSSDELKHTKEGSSVVMLHLLVTACVILADYVLYYILVVLTRYGEIDVTITGANLVTVTVDGSNPIANFLRKFLSTLQLDGEFDVAFNITQCLPNPSEPEITNVFTFFILYFIAGLFVYMQAFGLRMRRKVASLYYPEREFERIHWLHEKIRHKRMTIFGWLFQHLKSKKKEKDVSERITLSAWFYYRCPTFATYCGDCKPKRTNCLSCGVSDVGLATFRVCQTPGCDAVYCMDCFKEMKKRCFKCKKRKWDDDD